MDFIEIKEQESIETIETNTNETIHSKDPFVSTIDNLITDDECSHMINISKDLMKSSLVSDGTKGIVSQNKDQHDITKITSSSNSMKNEPYNNKGQISFNLEVGDYFPFVKINYVSGGQKEIYNFVDDQDFAIIHVKNIEQIKTIKRHPKINTIILFKEGSPTSEIKNISSNDVKMYNLFKENEKKINVYLLTPNRKIYKNYEIDSIDEYNNTPIERCVITGGNVPFLLIENVLSPELIEKILHIYDTVNKQSHNTTTKNRQHVHPNKELEIDIDNKLSRSLFPEIRKIFYFDVNYRELYKICSYDAETDGRFHAHRDTPYPFQHRRYAMSLCLNDDYEGGEFELPEYNFKIKPKANSALIFPGICSHKVNQVTKGSRKVIITFYCSEIDGKTKNNSLYTVKSNFFKENDVNYSEIYPI